MSEENFNCNDLQNKFNEYLYDFLQEHSDERIFDADRGMFMFSSTTHKQAEEYAKNKLLEKCLDDNERDLVEQFIRESFN